ncbi:MAG: class I SAM-dependent methyltransferase [Dehalococcoidia bacterium]|nr:class I SAM-dependent methyltransferase [Dehalococcoidia bacterium]
MNEQDKLQWIYSTRGNEELSERYDRWARDYDADLEEKFAYLAPQRAVEIFARYVPQWARILDAGAGSGLVGKYLAEEGYANLVAMDLSQGMLEEARKKEAYRDFHQMIMGEPLGFASDSFDGIISVGVFTEGHAPASSLDELVRIARPGGYIVFTLNLSILERGGFRKKQEALEVGGKWAFVEAGEKFQALPGGDPDVYLQVWVYQVAA